MSGKAKQNSELVILIVIDLKQAHRSSTTDWGGAASGQRWGGGDSPPT